MSFDIAPGEVLGVVGESGAGKSLTGNAIIGLLEPPGRIAGGEIRARRQAHRQLPYEEMRKVRGARIGAIFQDPLTSLNPLYSVGRQLVETIQTHLPFAAPRARRALDLLKEVGIPAAESRIGHYPHQFSGGMRQRVVIALALCAGPRLIVADEPTTALDVSIQAQIIALAEAALPRARHGGDAGDPRHGRDRRDRRSRRGDVCRPHRRDRAGARRGQARQASLHQGADGLDPELGVRTERLTQIDGAMPRLTESCRRAAPSTRAAPVRERCLVERPDLMPAGDAPRRLLAARSRRRGKKFKPEGDVELGTTQFVRSKA